jgi:hypothetical protein
VTIGPSVFYSSGDRPNSNSSPTVLVLYPGKGECADPVNEDAILEREGGGESQDRNGERQLASDTGGGKT